MSILSLQLPSLMAIYRSQWDKKRQHKNSYSAAFGWGGSRGKTDSWNFLPFLFKRDKCCNCLSLPKCSPVLHRPLTWELLGDRDQVSAFLSSQGRVCHPPKKVWVQWKILRLPDPALSNTQRPALLYLHHLLGLLPTFQKHKPIKKTKQNFGFSLGLKCFIIEEKNLSSTTTNTMETENSGI